MREQERQALIIVSKGTVTKQIPKYLEGQYVKNGWKLGKIAVRPPERTVRDGD